MSWHATVLTLFPEMFPGPLGLSLAGDERDSLTDPRRGLFWSASSELSRRAFGSSGTARPFCRSTQPASGSIRANGVSKTPSWSSPASASVRCTHQAVSPCTAIFAWPAISPT